MVKRSLEDEDSSDPTKRSRDEEKETDVKVLTAVKAKITETEQLHSELEDIKRKYLGGYLNTVLEKLPASREIILATRELVGDDFLKMYSVAKMCVQSDLQLKQMVAANAFIETIIGVVGKAIHDRVIAPYLVETVPRAQLDLAYEGFLHELMKPDESSEISTELHCITYLIQNEMEKSKPLRIPNPAFNRFSHHVKATAAYVSKIMKHMSTQPIQLTTDKKSREFQFVPTHSSENEGYKFIPEELTATTFDVTTDDDEELV